MMVQHSNTCAVIVTYNIGEGLHTCFQAIYKQVQEVIIVDNGSQEETLSVILTLQQSYGAHVIYNQSNIGIAGAMNLGIDYALKKGYAWILTLDHDSEAAPDMVENLLHIIAQVDEPDKVGILAANPFDINSQRSVYPEKYSPDCSYVARDIVISSGSLVNAAVFQRVGFFNEQLFIYFVDDEFCLRLRQSGYQILLCRQALLFHEEGVKIPVNIMGRTYFYKQYGNLAVYYISRNSIYMIRCYFKKLYYVYIILRRLLFDNIKILYLDEKPWKKLCFAAKGILDGIRGQYGKYPYPR